MRGTGCYQPNAILFCRQLAETIAWCTDRSSPAEAGDGLWTPEFRPLQLPERPRPAEIINLCQRPMGSRGLYNEPIADFWSYTHWVRGEIVNHVVEARARGLSEQGRALTEPAPDLAGGRLLLFEIDTSLMDGAAELATHGFFDGNSMPAWDTWVWYENDELRGERRAALRRAGDQSWTSLNFVGSLVSWIPPHILDLVHEGLEVETSDCIQWADTLDVGLTQVLKRMGLI